MAKKKKQTKRYQARMNLNLILWLSFAFFSLCIIVLFTVAQNIATVRRSREQVISSTQDAGQQLVYELRKYNEKPGTGIPSVGNIMLSVSNEYGVRSYLFSTSGTYIYPAILEEEVEHFQTIAKDVRERVEELSDKKNSCAVISTEATYSLAFSVELLDQEYYLYVTNSFQPYNELTGGLMWISIFIALFAVALASLMSGFVSMAITKPVSEVTERAKELARGNYDVTKPSNYYCTEVNDLSEALNYASSEISRADRMQKELIANISHDFKTPLTMIKSYAFMIQDLSGDDPEKRAKHTSIIIDEADRLALLVGDLLDLSKMQAGVDKLELTVFNLSEHIYSVLARFDYLRETAGYRFETEIDEDLYCYAARNRVEQVLYNLIGNAVNYTGSDKTVKIRLKKQEGCSHFEVIDSGSGIPPEELNTIWERYYRSSETHKRSVNGTGLGLSIVKTILQKHGFPFGVTSKVGEGSCFWVDFPIPPEDNVKNDKFM